MTSTHTWESAKTICAAIEPLATEVGSTYHDAAQLIMTMYSDAEEDYLGL